MPKATTAKTVPFVGRTDTTNRFLTLRLKEWPGGEKVRGLSDERIAAMWSQIAAMWARICGTIFRELLALLPAEHAPPEQRR